MKVSETVKKYACEAGKSSVISTANKAGETNIAMFGSPALIDDETVAIMLGENRTYRNLKENPYASYLLTLHGKTGMQTEGCRIYLKVRKIEDGGEDFDAMKAMIKAKVGKAAEMLKHRVVFDVIEVRPILDFGQGI
jgi:hypothetical protein